MKKVIVIVFVFILAVITAGYFLTKDIDWSTVDGVGAIVSPPLSAATSSAKISPSTLYVKCELDGMAYVMTAEACARARDQHGGMAP